MSINVRLASNQNIQVRLSGSVTSPAWGNIQGNLSDQTDLNNALNSKVDKVTGKQLSTEDYTTAEKTKLFNMENTIVCVGNNNFIESRYKTDGTDDQVQIQNAIDDVTDPTNKYYGAWVKVLPDVALNHNSSLVETLGSFNRRLAIQLKSGLRLEFKKKVTFSSGGDSASNGGSSTFTTAFGNWGSLSDVEVEVAEVDGLSTITGTDSDEHGLIWLDALSQGGSQVEGVHVRVKKAYNTASALFRFRGGLASTTNYVRGCSYACERAYDLDALATISRNAEVYHDGNSWVDSTFAEGIIVDGSKELTILGKLKITNSHETGLRISDNFSALPNSDVVVSGNIVIEGAEKHGVLLSGLERAKFDGLDVRDSYLNSIRITNEGGNSCTQVSFSNTKLFNANLGGVLTPGVAPTNLSDDNACHIYLNACDVVTYDESCTFGDDQLVKTTSRIANFNNATNVIFDGCHAVSTDFLSSSLFFNANTSTSNRIINVAGVNPNRMGFVTVTSAKPSLSLRNGTSQKIIFNQDITFDATNPLQSDLIRGQELTLIFEQGSTGASPGNYTVTIDAASNIKPKASFSVQTGVGVLTTLKLMFVSASAGWIEVGRTSNRQVYTDETQTLTNKTISGASNTLTHIAQSSVTNLITDLASKANLPFYGLLYMDQAGAASPAGTGLTTMSNVADTFVGLVGTAAAGANLNSFSVSTGSTSTIPRLTYTGTATKLFLVTCSYSAATSEATGYYSFALARNGTRLTETRAINRGSANDFAGSMTAIVSLSQNQYLELWGASNLTTGTNSIRLKALSLSAVAIN